MEVEQPLESTQLKGITVKLAGSIIIAAIMMTTTVMGTYFSLLSHMESNKMELRSQIDNETHQREMAGLQMKEMRIRLDALEVKVDQIKEKQSH